MLPGAGQELRFRWLFAHTATASVRRTTCGRSSRDRAGRRRSSGSAPATPGPWPGPGARRRSRSTRGPARRSGSGSRRWTAGRTRPIEAGIDDVRVTRPTAVAASAATTSRIDGGDRVGPDGAATASRGGREIRVAVLAGADEDRAQAGAVPAADVACPRRRRPSPARRAGAGARPGTPPRPPAGRPPRGRTPATACRRSAPAASSPTRGRRGTCRRRASGPPGVSHHGLRCIPISCAPPSTSRNARSRFALVSASGESPRMTAATGARVRVRLLARDHVEPRELGPRLVRADHVGRAAVELPADDARPTPRAPSGTGPAAS